MPGVPELIAAITSTTSSRDLGIKNEHKDIKPSGDGVLRSQVFPGLWLNSKALFAGDEAGLLAMPIQALAAAEHTAFGRAEGIASALGVR